MKQVIIEDISEDHVLLKNIPNYTPIFVKKDGILSGMVVKEESLGWITKIGGNLGASGYYTTRKRCIERDSTYNYEFFVV